MFLSNVKLNPQSRQVQRELSNPYEMHRTLMRSIPEDTNRAQAGMLFRVEQRSDFNQLSLSILVQTMIKPDWHFLETVTDYLLESQVAVKEFVIDPAQHQKYRFLLRANPTFRKKDTRQTLPIFGEKKLLDWLENKAEQSGFVIQKEEVLLRKIPQVAVTKKEEEATHRLQINMIDYSGFLEVNDPGRFKTALQTGIGRARSFGCGLLSLAAGN